MARRHATRVRALLLLLGTLVGGSACGEGPRASLPDLDRLPRLALIEELRIGSVDDPDRGFSEVDRHVEATAGDTVWVLERQDLTIRAYGPDGELVRRMGGRGDGPGELGFPGAWGIQNDTVWVIGFDRATLFRRDGTVIGAHRLEPTWVDLGAVAVVLAPREMLPGGRWRGGVVATRFMGTEPFRVDTVLPLLEYSPDTRSVDTVGVGRFEMEQVSGEIREVGGMPFRERDLPPDPPLRAGLEGDSLHLVRLDAMPDAPASVGLVRLDPAGDTVFVRRYGFRPIPVERSYVDSVMDATLERYARLGDDAGVRSVVEELYHVADDYPPVARLIATTDALWLLRQPGTEEGWRWTVLDPTGEPRGEVVMPPHGHVVHGEGDRVYVLERDELGIPWIVRYRLAPPPPPPLG